MMVSSDWAKALEPNIDEWIHEGFQQHPDTTGQLFFVSDEFSGGIIRLHDSWGAGRISKSSEGASTPEAQAQKGYESVLSPQIFKQKRAVTMEMVKRSLYSQIEDRIGDLGKSAIYTLNLIGASVLINGFNTSYTAYGE